MWRWIVFIAVVLFAPRVLAAADPTATDTPTPAGHLAPIRFTLQIPDSGPTLGCDLASREDTDGNVWKTCRYDFTMSDPRFRSSDTILCSTLAGRIELEMSCGCLSPGVLTIFKALPGAVILVQDFGAI